MSHWEAPGRSDDWYTPRYVFDALGCRFDLDVAAPFFGPRHVPCDHWLCADVMGGGLIAEWWGFVWMNAPFGGRNGLAPWLDKFCRHGNGVALVPDRTSAPWFQAYARRADLTLFVSPKIKFERPDGSTGDSPGTGTARIAMGDRGMCALRAGRRLGLLTAPA
jgi:hypothetical protein